MNKKQQKLMEPGMRLYLFILLAYAAATLFFDNRLAMAEGAVIFLLHIYSIVSARQRRREFKAYIESVTYNAESAANNTLINFPLPMVVFKLNDYGIIWGNQSFWGMCGRSEPSFEANLTNLVPDFSGKWLLEGKNQLSKLLSVGGRKYQVSGNMVRFGAPEEYRDFMGITYWVDVTEFDDVKQEYQNSRPAVAILVLDNYDELMKNAAERVRNELRSAVAERIERWCEGVGGLVRSVERDRTLFVFEKRHLAGIIAEKFSVVEDVRSVVTHRHQRQISIGIGVDGRVLKRIMSFAFARRRDGLSRGGDRPSLKTALILSFTAAGDRKSRPGQRSNPGFWQTPL